MKKQAYAVLIFIILLLQMLSASKILVLSAELDRPCERMVYSNNTEVLGSMDIIWKFSLVQEGETEVSLHGHTLENIHCVGKDPDFGTNALKEGEWYDSSSIVINEAMCTRFVSSLKVNREDIIGTKCTISIDDRNRVVTVKGICENEDNLSRIYMSPDMMRYLIQSGHGSMHIMLRHYGDIPDVMEKLKEYGIEMENEKDDVIVSFHKQMRIICLVLIMISELTAALLTMYFHIAKKGLDISSILRQIFLCMTILFILMIFFMIPVFNAYLESLDLSISWVSFAFLTIFVAVKLAETFMTKRLKR